MKDTLTNKLLSFEVDLKVLLEKHDASLGCYTVDEMRPWCDSVGLSVTFVVGMGRHQPIRETINLSEDI